MPFIPRLALRLMLVLLPPALTGMGLAMAQTAKPGKASAGLAAQIKMPPLGPTDKPLFDTREFTDSRSSLELTLPAGWMVIELARVPKDTISLIRIDGPGMPSSSCRLAVRTPKQPPKITQAQMNKIMHDNRNLTAIRSSLGKEGREVVAVNKLNVKGINGLQAQVRVPGAERRPSMTLSINFFETVGRAYSLECTMLTADYDNVGKSIDALVKSLRFAPPA